MDSQLVWRTVEEFRAKHIAGRLRFLPADVFGLAEIDLRLDVIPFPSLYSNYRIDAAVTQDFTGIYIDEESYVTWDTGLPKFKEKRLRFSVAHELGHIILHKEIAAKHPFSTFDEFRGWLKSNKFTHEQEANEFAGRLLVPHEKLVEYYDEFACKIKDVVTNWYDLPQIRASFAEGAAPKFGVSTQALECRLDREGIWPSP